MFYRALGFGRVRRLSFLVSLAVAAVACSKAEVPTEDTVPVAPASAPKIVPSAPPVESAAPVASASPSAVADASVDAKVDGVAPAKGAANATEGDAAAAPTCGKKPLPDCPMQAWMKANTSAAMSSKDFAALEIALKKTATFAPGAGYPNWVSISKDGAEAARTQNLDALKASCRGCHDQYKSKYKAELRTRPVT